jgi:SAM-dependent methyltransferase
MTESFKAEFVRAAHQSKAVQRPRRLATYFTYLLKPVESADRVLDIGGGAGSLSIFAAIRLNAQDVVCLEPNAAGSNDSMMANFAALQAKSGLADRVRLDRRPLESLVSEEPFDLVMLHNSINHLNESAVPHLGVSSEARDAYLEYLTKVAKLAKPGGWLVVADCSPKNLFARLEIRNPVAPTINWSLHQPPELWADLLRAVGFSSPKIRWTGVSRLGAIGSILTRNRPIAYCLNSHFALTMRRSAM